MTSTLWPRKLNPWARVAVVVVLLTPPLKLQVAITIASAGFGRIWSALNARDQVLVDAKVNGRFFLPGSGSSGAGKSPLVIRYCISESVNPQSSLTWLAKKNGGFLANSGANMLLRTPESAVLTFRSSSRRSFWVKRLVSCCDFCIESLALFSVSAFYTCSVKKFKLTQVIQVLTSCLRFVCLSVVKCQKSSSMTQVIHNFYQEKAFFFLIISIILWFYFLISLL